jgi:hypothetical protein
MFGMGQQGFKISGQLSYGKIVQLMLEMKKNRNGEVLVYNGRKNYALRMQQHEHPTKHKYEEAGCFRHYNTDILQFFRDGTIKIVRYNSTSTNHLESAFGPIYIGSNSRVRYKHKLRWCPRNRSPSDGHYPMNGDIVVRKDGTVHGMVDVGTRIKSSVKKRRRELSRKFREAALPRLVLGEFDCIVRDASEGGWLGYVPYSTTQKRVMFDALLAQADHDLVRSTYASYREALCTGWARNEISYNGPLAAAEGVIRSLLRAALDDPKDVEEYTIKYPPIQVFNKGDSSDKIN